MKKITALSLHPGSELWSADLDKYFPWFIGPFTVHISIWISMPTPWGLYSRPHAACRHGLQIDGILPKGPYPPCLRMADRALLAGYPRNMPSRIPIGSWVERSNAAWSALLRCTQSRRIGKVFNPALDLDSNRESCTLPLDQLAATLAQCGAVTTQSIFSKIYGVSFCGTGIWLVFSPSLHNYPCNILLN